MRDENYFLIGDLLVAGMICIYVVETPNWKKQEGNGPKDQRATILTSNYESAALTTLVSMCIHVLPITAI